MTTVVFVHGVGGAMEGWADPLLAALGDQGIYDVNTVTIRFDDLVDLSRMVGRSTSPGLNAGPYTKPDVNRADRTAYYGRLRALERQVVHSAGVVPPPRILPPFLIPGTVLVRLPWLNMHHAGHYRHNADVRRAIHDRVEDELSRIDDDIVLIGHSLGAVVVLDVVHFRNIQAKLLITIGASLGSGHFWCKRWEDPATFPYGSIGAWLNVVNLRDFIPWQRGASWRFPQTVDVFLNTGNSLAGEGSVHDARTYTRSGPVIDAVAMALE